MTRTLVLKLENVLLPGAKRVDTVDKNLQEGEGRNYVIPPTYNIGLNTLPALVNHMNCVIRDCK